MVNDRPVQVVAVGAGQLATIQVNTTGLAPGIARVTALCDGLAIDAGEISIIQRASSGASASSATAATGLFALFGLIAFRLGSGSPPTHLRKHS